VPVTITYTEREIKQLIANDANQKLGSLSFNSDSIHLLVKSTQNYKSTWESAGVLATNDEAELATKVPQLKAELKA